MQPLHRGSKSNFITVLSFEHFSHVHVLKFPSACQQIVARSWLFAHTSHSMGLLGVSRRDSSLYEAEDRMEVSMGDITFQHEPPHSDPLCRHLSGHMRRLNS